LQLYEFSINSYSGLLFQADLVKDGGHHYFIKYLEGTEPGISADSRAQAAFVLAVICDGYPRGRLLCAEQGLLPKLLSLLATMVRACWLDLQHTSGWALA
jgi:hypothetical protein